MNLSSTAKWILGFGALALLGIVVAFSLPKRQGGGQCDCTPITQPQAALDSADLAFVGTVTNVTTNWISGGMKFSFTVDRAWKRRVDSMVIVNSGWEGDCGARFETGKRYLVFANKKFSLQTNRCNGTQSLASAGPMLDYLDQQPTVAMAVSPMLTTMYWTIGSLGIFSLLFLAVVIFRRKLFPPK